MPHTGLTVTETAPRGLTRTARVPVHAPALGPRRVRQTTRVLVPFFAARNNVAVSGWTTFRVPILIPRTPGADSDKRGWRARPFSCARASAAAGPRAGAASRPGHGRSHACATVPRCFNLHIPRTEDMEYGLIYFLATCVSSPLTRLLGLRPVF